MEEIIGLLVVLAIGIFKAVNKKFENAGKKPESPSQPFGPFGSLDPFGGESEVFAPKEEPATPKPSVMEIVQRQTNSRKPMLVEEEEKGPKEKIDPKKLVLYSEIMTPKFNE